MLECILNVSLREILNGEHILRMERCAGIRSLMDGAFAERIHID